MDIYDGSTRLDAILTLPDGSVYDPDNSDAKKIGKSPIVIIIHGFTGQKEEDHLLAVEREVVSIGMASLRVDMYGHGKSDGRFFDHTLSRWFLNLMAIVDYAEKLEFTTDIYLCGHSQGGLTVMMGAAMMHDKIKGLIPMSPAWVIPDQARKGEILQNFFDKDNPPESIYLPNVDMSLGGHYLREAQQIDVKSVISKYKGPVLIVHGTKDESVLYKWSKEIVSVYDDVELVPIEDDTHCFDLHADLAAIAVRQWLEKQIEK